MAKKTAKELLEEAIKNDSARPAKMPKYTPPDKVKLAPMPEPNLPKKPSAKTIKTWADFKPTPEMKKKRK